MIIDFLFYFFIIVISILIMELVAILSHKYIMHGPGWFLHKSHHTKHQHRFELNDIYFIIFASPSCFCLIYGLLYSNYIFISIGIGIFLYGCIYIFLHDLLVHQRFGIKLGIKNSYLNKIKKVHLQHHRNVRDKINVQLC